LSEDGSRIGYANLVPCEKLDYGQGPGRRRMCRWALWHCQSPTESSIELLFKLFSPFPGNCINFRTFSEQWNYARLCSIHLQTFVALTHTQNLDILSSSIQLFENIVQRKRLT